MDDVLPHALKISASFLIRSNIAFIDEECNSLFLIPINVF